MDVERRLELIAAPPTEEVVTIDEIRNLIETGVPLVAYDGFEPSGKAHIATGLMRAIKVKDMLDAGVTFKILLADWHAWINKKMGGDLETIKAVGRYLIKAWEACGVPTNKCEVLWASDLVEKVDYWEKVIKIAKNTTVARANRCLTIMGRNQSKGMDTAQLFYPMMQVADIFQLGVNVCQLGMDQRKANMLAREVGEKLGYWKPSAVHHHIMAGLIGPSRMDVGEPAGEFDDKMSKSKKGSAIFIHDTPDEVRAKMKKAYCPAGEVEGNPVMEIARYIIFRKMDVMEVKRKEKFGGDVQYENFDELKEGFLHPKGSKGIHPFDLKMGVADALNEILEPVRKYFDKNKQYLEVFEKREITR
ncbi:MAG: tyrosine--tRNA ligase [Promethearchaeota archaeon]